jgi:RimJ/RimL family protein N-acetyltransferase
MPKQTIPTLTTQRLVLRPWRDADIDPFAALNADPVVMEHFPATLTPAEATSLAEGIQQDLAERGFGWWAAEIPGEAPFIGFIGLSVPTFEAQFTPCVEIGWRLAKEHWGRGYAKEGARECLRFGFEDLALKEIVSFTAIPNLRSQAVMQRLGMTHDPADDFDHPKLPEGHPLRRHVLYRIGRSAWQSFGQ